MRAILTTLLTIILIDSVRPIEPTIETTPDRFVRYLENKRVDTSYREWLVRKENIVEQRMLYAY